MPTGDWYPYFLVDRVTLDANGAGVATLSIGQQEEFEGEEIDFVVSAGTFRITAINDSGGKGYTNAATSDPLPSEMFLTALDQRTNFHKFASLLIIQSNGQLTITFASGTASATIDVCIKGKRRTIVPD